VIQVLVLPQRLASSTASRVRILKLRRKLKVIERRERLQRCIDYVEALEEDNPLRL
jgi:hypothetical protein